MLVGQDARGPVFIRRFVGGRRGSKVEQALGASCRKPLGPDVAHALLRAAATLVSLPRAAGNTEASPRVGAAPWRERLWRHEPLWKASARGPIENRPQDKILPHTRLQHRSVSNGLPGGLWRAATRHARVRAPLACSATIVRTAKGLWRQRRSRSDRPPLVSLPRAAGSTEASPRVATRHARVRAPLACSATIARTAKGLWRQRGSQLDRPPLLPTPRGCQNSEVPARQARVLAPPARQRPSPAQPTLCPTPANPDFIAPLSRKVDPSRASLSEPQASPQLR